MTSSKCSVDNCKGDFHVLYDRYQMNVCTKHYIEHILVYKATRNGLGTVDFHRCSDNQGSTITVIQSKDNQYLFASYISVSCNSTGTYAVDNNHPFLFTLTNPLEAMTQHLSVNMIALFAITVIQWHVVSFIFHIRIKIQHAKAEQFLLVMVIFEMFK
ncbi:unnamed protein product [Rotaria magnacalcarata]